MLRRSFIKNTGLTLGALTLLNKHTLAAFLRNPACNIKMLTGDIGIFTERGGTILFMLGKNGTVVVDAQFPDTAQHCIDEIKKRSDKPFDILINTHHHSDHTAGNIAFQGLVKHVLGHENSRINQQNVAVKNKSEDRQLYPDLTYASLLSGRHSNETITMYYFGRGHTNGDSLVHFEKANIVHAGDLVFNRRHPFVDKTAGADIGEWIKTLDSAMAAFKDDAVYVCGHALEGYDTVLGKKDLLAFRVYLENVLRYTRDSFAKGLSKEDFLKATEIPGSPEWKGDGINRPLEAAWTELSNPGIR